MICNFGIKAGLPHGQEKSGNQEKLKKWQKSGKHGVFVKSHEFFLKKHQILSVQIYKIPYIEKPSIGK